MINIKKEANFCDYCLEENIMSVSENRCDKCGKDICKHHTHWLQLYSYRDIKEYAIEIRVSGKYDKRAVSQLPLCQKCTNKYRKVLISFNGNDDRFKLDKLMETIIDIAEIEAI